jgi:hypothetical protein
MAKRKVRNQIDKFDYQPLKVRNRHDFLVCRWCATCRWKSLDEGYKFSLNLISIEGMYIKLCAPKVAKVPTLKISGLPSGSSKTKWHLGVGLVTKHRVYCKGEGGGFPQVQAMVNLVNSCLLMVLPNTKNIQTMH